MQFGVGAPTRGITVTDSTTPTHATASATLSLAIAPALTITTTALPGGVNGVAYSATAGATGGNTPYSWSATGLPSGLTINSSTGAISGTTSANGSASVTLRVADSSSPAATTSATFPLTISAAGTVTLTAPANQAVGQSTTPTLTWTAATNATSYTLYLDTANPPVTTYTVSGTSYTPSTALAIGQPYYWYVVPVNGSASGQPSPTWTFWTAGPPSGTSVSPASGGPPSGGLGTPTPFTFTFSSPNGWQQLWSEVEFNYYNFGSGACLIGFWPATQQVALMSDHAVDGWQWIGTLGQTQTEPANSQCSVSLDQTQSYMTVVSPTTIQVRLTITFLAGMPGPQQIWAQSGDNQGNTAYWQQLGTWTTSVVNNARPTTGPEGVKSGSWSGGGDTFTYQAASANGWAYLTDFTAAFAAAGTGLYPGPHICRVDYSRLSNTISLETDNGVGDPAAQSVPLGSNQILSNSQCTLNVGQSSTQVVDANTLQWNVALTFNPSWTTKSPTDYFYIFDRQYQGPVEYTNTGWAEAGPYNITAPSTIVTSNPPGLTVTVDGTGCTTPCTFQWGANTSHTISAPATMSGTGVQGTFASWSDGGAATHTVTATASSITYTATYANIQYYLTTAVSPANTGTVSPASGWYNAGTQVTITASAASGQQFSSFAGTSNGLSNPMTVTMTQAVTETAQFTTATPIFTVLPQPPPPYGWQPVQQGVPMVYTVLPPTGYIGTIQLGSASSFSCTAAGAQVTGVNVGATGNPDGSLTVTVTEDPTIFPLSPCYQRKAGNNVYFTLNLNVYGINPNVSQESFQLPIQVLLTTPTVSISPSLVSKTATTATYVETVSTQGYTGPVTLGLQSGSCATILGSTPTVQLTGSGSTNMPITLSTAGCAAGTNTAITFTGTGSGTSAPAVTLLLQTAPASAVMTTPPPGATIRGGATTFSWSTVTGATQYSLMIGSSVGASDIYNNANLGTVTSVSGVALPTNNTTVYATLGTLVGGAWQMTPAVYTITGSPNSSPLTLVGVRPLIVPNNGVEVAYVYYFIGGDNGGDARTVNQVTTNVNGVSPRIISQTINTVTVGYKATAGLTPQPMLISICQLSGICESPCFETCGVDPSPILAVSPGGAVLGTAFQFTEGIDDISYAYPNAPIDIVFTCPPAAICPAEQGFVNTYTWTPTTIGSYTARLGVEINDESWIWGSEQGFTVTSPIQTAGTVSGTVTNSVDGSAVQGVTIKDSSGGQTTTDKNGNYTISINQASDILTPSMSGWTFNPPNAQANGTPGVNVNYIATQTGALPSITSIVPSSTTPDQANGDLLFSVYGANLVSSNASDIVFVDSSGNPDSSIAFTITNQGDTVIEGTIYMAPGVAAGAHSFYVEAPNGNSNQLPLTVQAAPVITSVTPSTFTAGQGQVSVTIIGQHLAASCATNPTVTVCTSGSSPCTQTQDVVPALPPPTCTDTEIDTTFTISSNASGSYDVLVGSDPTAASGIGNAMMAANQQGPTSRATVQVGSSAQVRLQVKTNNGQTLVAQGSTLYIANGTDQYETPAMPQIQAQIVDNAGNPVTTGQASWALAVTFPQYMSNAQWAKGAASGTPVPQTVSAAADGPQLLNVDASQLFQAKWGSNFVGGDATINWYYNNFKQSPFSFVIRGTNPDQSAVARRLSSSYWFAANIAMHETRQSQFCDPNMSRTASAPYCNCNNQPCNNLPNPPQSGTNAATSPISSVSMPIYGHPKGYGAMQLDTPLPTIRQIWNWQANVDGGIALLKQIAGDLTDQQATGYGYWNQQVSKWQVYNQKVAAYASAANGANQLTQIAAPESYEVAIPLQLNTNPPTTVQTWPIPNCRFVGTSTPPTGTAGTYWYGDAVVMKRYAGSWTCKNKRAEYITWHDTGVPPTGGPAGWTFNKDTGPSGDIVYEFCQCGTVCTGALACPTQGVGLNVATTSLPNAVLGHAYSVSLSASGGFPGKGYTWSLAAGTLPNGLQFTSGGQLTGAPKATGTFGGLVFYVADSVGNTATAILQLTVTSQ